jgi:RNA polymerase sigma-70 factor (ECF subfamily)
VHCYRMLGSAEEAEDVVQETYLRAWRSHAGFEGRSSARTWLYRIATNACLTAIERCGRRPLPAGLGGPSDDSVAPEPAPPEMPWLRPLPDALLAAERRDPTAVTASRAGVGLAMVAALRYLPARQRALLDRFAAAFEDGDVTALATLLREDVALEMPPLATWFSGRETVLGYVASNLCATAGRMRLLPAAANGQPAFAAYLRDADGAYRAHAMIVLTLTGALITRIVIFLEPALFRLFGLNRELPPGESGHCRWSASPVGSAEVAAVEQAGGEGNKSRTRRRSRAPRAAAREPPRR